uniref:(northern house mosquito) hypothetical protein n=1 Tax=Culex pipiens TaxID=7175 RepID=A0A8D8CN34_CULPI
MLRDLFCNGLDFNFFSCDFRRWLCFLWKNFNLFRERLNGLFFRVHFGFLLCFGSVILHRRLLSLHFLNLLLNLFSFDLDCNLFGVHFLLSFDSFNLRLLWSFVLNLLSNSLNSGFFRGHFEFSFGSLFHCLDFLRMLLDCNFFGGHLGFLFRCSRFLLSWFRALLHNRSDCDFLRGHFGLLFIHSRFLLSRFDFFRALLSKRSDCDFLRGHFGLLLNFFLYRRFLGLRYFYFLLTYSLFQCIFFNRFDLFRALLGNSLDRFFRRFRSIRSGGCVIAHDDLLLRGVALHALVFGFEPVDGGFRLLYHVLHHLHRRCFGFLADGAARFLDDFLHNLTSYLLLYRVARSCFMLVESYNPFHDDSIDYLLGSGIVARLYDVLVFLRNGLLVAFGLFGLFATSRRIDELRKNRFYELLLHLLLFLRRNSNVCRCSGLTFRLGGQLLVIDADFRLYRGTVAGSVTVGHWTGRSWDGTVLAERLS